MQKVFIYMRYRESIYQKSENEQFTVIYLYARNKNIYFTNCPRMKNGQRTKKSGTRSSNSNNKKKRMKQYIKSRMASRRQNLLLPTFFSLHFVIHV